MSTRRTPTPEPDHESIVAGLVQALEGERRDLQEKLSDRQRELAFLATHDPLTALPNRRLVLERAEELLARTRSDGQVCGAIFIDLDGFKAVNDGLGRDAGDELLVAVAARLHEAIPSADTIGRLGGDQFVVLLDHAALAEDPANLAERVLRGLSEPFLLSATGSGGVALSASLGLALGDRCAGAELLRDADIAMYSAKLAGRNRLCIFESGMEDAAHERMQLEMSLRDAAACGGFELVYQPMLDLHRMAPVRMEALLRWPAQYGDALTPDQFVPVLEQSGLITEVGRWVLAEACVRCAEWVASGLDIGVAVNVSAVQLENGRFVDDVAAALQSSGLAAERLTLELTETALMHDAERAGDRLWAIKTLGVRISIDDFGTGYSSLAYLQHFPVDELKIDRSFVSQLLGASQDDALIRTFLQLGRSLEIETIAEGIEDRVQLERLRAHDCDFGQGFLFARPLDGERCGAFLRGWVDHGATPPELIAPEHPHPSTAA